MSGGFFRGTSADQDTRFSNKQAKLLKSQKFPPELEHLVDMTKVKMDVMRPWIANRVNELIGFEDEVLINFIYGLLEGKQVNGKEIQISLTGFMERNTGKFMKELWALLLSAQNNSSGVPQQFLDAKEEETLKMKAESDRIADNIQRKKETESRELEQEINKKMDADNDITKGVDAGREPSSKHLTTASRERLAEEKGPKERNGSRFRSRMRSRSVSKSPPNFRSHSKERHMSRSLSASPKRRGRSSSSEMVRRSSPTRSLTPRRRHSPTPPRRRSSYSRRHMSPYPTRYRMRSPRRQRSRSPLRRRSRSPVRRRSRSPIRRSVPRNRSGSPVRHSPSSMWRRSPYFSRQRSPSPIRDRSPSPVRRRYRGSPLSPQLRSSPVRHRSAIRSRRRSPSPSNRRSPSPQDLSSPSPARRRSPLPIRRSLERQRSPVESPRGRKRDLGKDSPVRNASPRSAMRRRSKSLEKRSSESWVRDNNRRNTNTPPSPRRSPPVSEDDMKMSPNGNRRSSCPPHSPSPRQRSRDYKHHRDSSERSADDKDASYLRDDDKRRSKILRDTSMALDQHKDSHGKDDVDELSTERLGGRDLVQAQTRTGGMDSDKNTEVLRGVRSPEKMDDPKKPGREESQNIGDKLLSRRVQESPVGKGYIALKKNESRTDDIKVNDQHLDSLPKLSRKVEQKYESSSEGSGSKEGDKKRSKAREKRKKKRLERQGSDSEDESSYDAYEEDRKEAKRRRKEEKISRKEEKRQRREERCRKKEERRAEKLKLKSVDAVSSPSEAEKNHEDRHVKRRQSRRSNLEETETEQKKLEIELRGKALENLRAKKSIGH